MMPSTTPFNISCGGAGEEPIQLIHSKRGTNIYRHGNVGYKVLMCPEEDVHRPSETAVEIVSEEQILKFVREQTISRYLPHGCNKRRVVDVKGFKGNPSLYFEWVEGNSLKQWMKEQQELGCARGWVAGSQDLMAQRLKVAMSITKSLDQFHFGGVAYNFLTLDHILLRWMGDDKNDEQLCTASLINLSRAVVFAEVSEQEAKEAIRKDLSDLGLILCALFSGESDVSSDVESPLSEDDSLLSDLDERNTDHTCDDREAPAPKRGKQRTLGDGLPTYVASMISALVGGENVDASELYDSASDVLKDLQVVAKNPGLCSVPNVKAEVRESLVMPKTFYGRRNEVDLLTRSLQTVAILGKPSIAVISGRGGAGKTSLIKQIKKPLEDINGRFIQVKFDLNTQSDTVLFSAMDSFIDGLSDDEEGMNLKQRIKESLGPEITVVANSIPSVAKMIDNYEISSKIAIRAEAQQQEQMISALCKLIGSIATRKNPIVLFLDDLHWADKSLDVVQRIFVSPDIRHCFFLTCYRDNDFTLAKSVEAMLDGIQSQEDMSIIKVPLGGLEIDFTHELISESLCLPPNLKSVKQLANVVHHKTGGLIFYMKSFLYELCDEGLLCFNLNQRWQFNLDRIMQKDISGDVVQHLKHRMARLAKSRYLLGLRIASCLGSSFSVKTFQRATDMKGINLDGFVQFVQSNGFILSINQTTMHWVHDSVQQAAYKTISRSKIDSFHLLVAGRLLVRTPQDDLDECVFEIVRHMNKGINLIKTPEQKYDGAQLNLRAGQKAMSSCSFHSAAKYFVCGIKILSDESWGDNYDLTLDLHRMAGKALLAIGDERINTVVANVLANARCFEDEVLAHLFQMRYLTSLGQSDEVIRLGKDLLQKLDEPLPIEVSKNVIIQEFTRTKARLKTFTEEDLLTLPSMTDKKKSTAMLILSYIVDAAILCQPFLIPLLSFRLMNLTLDHGVSSFSASFFSTYGCWLVNNLISDFEEGFRIGQVATKLMNRRGDEYMNAQVFVSVYGLINVWRQPFQACLDMLLEGYEVGIRQGDIENAFNCLGMYGQMTMCCGSSLHEMVDRFRLYCKNAIMFKKYVYAHSLVGQLQLALSLIGSSEDAYQTFFKTTKADSEHGCIQTSIESDGGGYINHFRLIPFRNKLFFFLMDGPDKEIRKWYELAQKVDETSTQVIFPRRIYGFFIDGMIAFSFARKYKDERGVWKEIGNNMISKFQKWKESSEWNFANKLYLLLAERFFLQDDQESAFEYYGKAIKAACDHRFLHEEGLANVAAAKCCLHYEKKKEAMIHYANAKDCYQRWGATALVNMIDNKCSNL